MGPRSKSVIALTLAGLAGCSLALLPSAFADSSSGPTLSVDPAFGGGNPVSLTFPVPAGCSGVAGRSLVNIAHQSDGKLLVVGTVVGSGCSPAAVTDAVVARLTSAGQLDQDFGSAGYAEIADPGGGTVDGLSVAAEPSDGKVVVGGYESTNSGPLHPLLARLNSNGTIDSGFAGGGVYVDMADSGDSVKALAIDGSGRILTAGDGGDLRRYSVGSGGAVTLDWHSPVFLIGGNGSPGATALAIQADGNIVVAGTSYPTPQDQHFGIVARVLAADGTMDPSFGTGGCPNVSSGCTNITPSSGGEILRSMALENGNILVSGQGADGGALLARLDSAGHLDSGFGTAERWTFPRPTCTGTPSTRSCLTPIPASSPSEPTGLNTTRPRRSTRPLSASVPTATPAGP